MKCSNILKKQYTLLLRRPAYPCVRLPACICLCIGLSADATAFAQDSDLRVESAGVVTQFKRFVESPPPIERIIFRVKLLVNPTRPDLGVGGSTNYHFYCGRWQTNAWSLQSIWPQDDPQQRLIRGRTMIVFTDRHWHLDPTVAINWYDDDPIVDGVRIELHSKIPNRTRAVAQFLRLILSEVMNMGILNVPPGTVRWNGNEFHAFYPQRHQDIRGRLTTSRHGLPQELYTTYTAGTNVGRYITKYTHSEKPGNGFLPEAIETFRLGNGRPVEYSYITILSIDIGKSEAGDEAFSAAAFIATNRLPVRFFTNGALFALNKRGDFVVADEPRPRPLRTPSSVAFYLVIALTTSAFITLAIMAKTRGTISQP